MDWKPIISELMAAGVTQKEIGENIGLKQPSVSDLARGVTTEVGWVVGEKLLALHAKHCRGDVSQSVDGGGAVSTKEATHQPPSRLRPRLESGQGANPGCQTEDLGSTGAAAETDARVQAGAKRTASSDVLGIA